MNGALLDIVLAAEKRSIVIVGTAKNVGKTTVLGALRSVAHSRGISGAVTSIGRDGEAVDALNGAAKPRVRLEAGTVVALPRGLLPASPAFEILGRGDVTALGPMIFARVRQATHCEIGGPPTARAVRTTIERLCRLTDGPVFVDGAIDRVAPVAGGNDAIVLATGAVRADTLAVVAEDARLTVARLSLPARGPVGAGDVAITGAVDARLAQELLRTLRAGSVVVLADPTRLALRGKLLERFLAVFAVRCEHALTVVACTTSSAGGRRPLDPRALVRAVAAATRLPTFDVVAGLSA